MAPRFLLDTQIVLRWFFDVRRLSKPQARTLDRVLERHEPVALSAISLLEIAILSNEGKLPSGSLQKVFSALQGDPVFRIVPLSYEVAAEAGALMGLRDPSDRVIVATARLHRLQLLTSDQRIIDSNLVPVID